MTSVQYIKLSEVGNLTGLSRSTIYRLPDFPQPKRFGASSRWSLQEVLDWIEEQPSRTAPAEAEVQNG